MKIRPRFNWRHQYDDARDQVEGDLAGLTTEGPSLTQQHFTEDADLNVIARRFGIDHPAQLKQEPNPVHFRDTTQDPELVDILNLQRAAREGFAQLPAKILKRFDHDPRKLWDFLNDPDNEEEAVRLGLLARATTRSSAGADAPDQDTSGSKSRTPTGPVDSASRPEHPPKPPTGGTDT